MRPNFKSFVTTRFFQPEFLLSGLLSFAAAAAAPQASAGEAYGFDRRPGGIEVAGDSRDASSGAGYHQVSLNQPVSAKDSRPKIGLALSGGGARGAAHLGVLRVLEEHNIPIDYIAGTSMGAIVGGLYSAGLNTLQLEQALANIDWAHVFNDLPSRQERSFRRKRDDDFYLVKQKLGLNETGVALPLGVVQGQKIALVLSSLLISVAEVSNFDELGIPFRAVASDIETGKEVVLGKGDLATAIRASMSIPAVFAPTEIDGQLLVDGGVANNLPISVVREMGADIVIAIDIGTPLLAREDIDSVVAITNQLTGLLTRRMVEAQIATLTDRDVLVVPAINGVSTFDFSQLAKAIAPGRAAMEEQISSLQAYALRDTEFERHVSARAQPAENLPIVDRIRLVNDTNLSEAYLLRRLSANHIGQPLSTARLEKDIGDIYGLELFQNVVYDVLQKDGETILEISAVKRPWGPNYLQFGVEYDSNADGENLFNVGLSYARTAMNSRGGEWRSGLQLGSEPSVFTEFHQPFGPRLKYFVNPFVGYRQQIISAVNGSDVVASFDIKEVLGEIGIGRELGSWGEARIGYRLADGHASRRIGDPMFPDISFQRGEAFARLSLDEFDDFYFPRSGSLVMAEWTSSRETLGADTRFDQFSVLAGIAYTRNRNTVFLNGRYSSTISGTAPIQSEYRLGGFGQLSGFSSNQLSGQHVLLGTLAFYRQLNQSGLLPVFAGLTLEKGGVWEERENISFGKGLLAGSAWLGAETPIGPAYIAYGRVEGGVDALHFFLGRAF